MKLGYGAIAIFSLVEYFRIKDRVNNYFTAKLAGLLALEMTVIVIFYSYTSLTGEHLLLPDILSYVAGVVACQYLTHVFSRMKPLPRPVYRLGAIACLAVMVLFGVATYRPPHTALFRENNSQSYGIRRGM